MGFGMAQGATAASVPQALPDVETVPPAGDDDRADDDKYEQNRMAEFITLGYNTTRSHTDTIANWP